MKSWTRRGSERNSRSLTKKRYRRKRCNLSIVAFTAIYQNAKKMKEKLCDDCSKRQENVDVVRWFTVDVLSFFFYF